jgi:hypothetical protein
VDTFLLMSIMVHTMYSEMAADSLHEYVWSEALPPRTLLFLAFSLSVPHKVLTCVA